MEYLEDLPEVKAELVETKLEEYDSSKDYKRFFGKVISFKKKGPSSKEISDLIIMADRRVILDKGKNGRLYVRDRKVKSVISFDPSESEKVLELVTAYPSPANKGKVTKFVKKNPNEPRIGDCLLIVFETSSRDLNGNYLLGMITPAINYIENGHKK